MQRKDAPTSGAYYEFKDKHLSFYTAIFLTSPGISIQVHAWFPFNYMIQPKREPRHHRNEWVSRRKLVSLAHRLRHITFCASQTMPPNKKTNSRFL